MAQILYIPLAFEFRPLRAKWSVRTVEIVGWAKDVRRPSLLGYHGNSDSVTVEVLEAGALGGFAGLFGMFGIRRKYSDLKNPAVLRWSDIPNEIKLLATPAKDMDLIQGRTFGILACESLNAAHGRPGDAWDMRRDFLKLKQNLWALFEFLRKWGVWDERTLGASNFAPGTNASIQNIVFPDAIWNLQSTYNAALLNPPDEWLSKGVDPFKGAYATPMYPHFVLEHSRCKLAIEATITVDLLRKVKFRKCKRPDCSEVFALESGHKRLYCGQYCAHLESVRKQRRKAAREKSKLKPKRGA